MIPRMTRRRFLAISAGVLAHPLEARPLKWSGFAMGAEVSLSIDAPHPLAEKAIAAARARLHEVETVFSLYDPASALSKLNASGRLANPPEDFRALMEICGRMHQATGGVFDPTIQPLWRALARGGDLSLKDMKIGWHHVETGRSIRLAPGQAVTLNGIAQGFATDLIKADLARIGLRKALVNIGEFASVGGPFRLGVADPHQGVFATARLQDSAIATSSPGAMHLSGRSHILHPALARDPVWATVSVGAQSAAVADAASTAFSLMTRPEIEASLSHLPRHTDVIALAVDGSVHRIAGQE